MRPLLLLLFLVTALSPASAQTDDPLSALMWEARPIIVFAESERDPRFRQQLEMLEYDMEQLKARDVVVLTDTEPSTLSALRKKLRPRGFMLVLIGKDGSVALRKPAPLTAREIIRTIDKMPLRIEELGRSK